MTSRVLPADRALRNGCADQSTARAGQSQSARDILQHAVTLIRNTLALLMFAPTAWAGLLQEPVDLHSDGERAMSRGKPVVILFSFPGCVYCQVVRQNYLFPLVRDLPERQQPVIREIEISSSASFVGFQREQISHQAFAQQYKVRVAPTVLFLDGAGKMLAPPIIGGDTAGLYGGYLDNAFAEAERKLNKGRRADTNGDNK